MAAKAIVLTSNGVTDVHVLALESGVSMVRLAWGCELGGPYYIYGDGKLLATEANQRTAIVPSGAVLFEVFRVAQQVDLCLD